MPKAKKAPKPYNWDQKITSALRKVWRFSDTRRAALEAARSLHNPKDVICAACGAVVDKRTAAVDHIEPVVPLTGFDSWDAYIERLKSSNLRVLCEPCHGAVTKEQNAARRANKPKKLKQPRKKK